MAMTYRTKEGEMLDWICWRHYGQRSRLEQAAGQLDPRLREAGNAISNDILALGQQNLGDLRGVVEAVLNSNPDLANYGAILPAGLNIVLPDISAESESAPVLQLWD